MRRRPFVVRRLPAEKLRRLRGSPSLVIDLATLAMADARDYERRQFEDPDWDPESERQITPSKDDNPTPTS